MESIKFRRFIISGKHDSKWGLRPIKNSNDMHGVSLVVDDNIIINCDYGRSIKRDHDTLEVNLCSTYSPLVINSTCLGLNELPKFYININWYENNIDANIIYDSWKFYEDVLHFSEIIGALIYRDAIMLLKQHNFGFPLSPIPSWDVCVVLPLYMSLCKNIPGFESKLKRAGDVGGHIKGNIKKINKRLKNRSLRPETLDSFLIDVHALCDELEMAYHINKLGYDLSFGNPEKEEPDYVINGIPAELKSRFPRTEPSLNESNSFDYPIQYEDMIRELTRVEDGLMKADIYFNNITRGSSALKFYYAVEMEKFAYKRCADFGSVMSDVMKSCRSKKFIVPYVKPFCSNPKVIAFPISKNEFDKIWNKSGRRSRP